ncbi:unnamed protein product [Brassica napus]|uniref:(rape) hypothetical protein n=1 Tax=Brassica napus TaxID=3708 RepID=A0A816JGH3_BRANA|nr:unnamed protein product [Brassica napus]
MALNLMLLFRCKKILVDQQIWKKGRCDVEDYFDEDNLDKDPTTTASSSAI